MTVCPVDVGDDLRGRIVDCVADLRRREYDLHFTGPEAEEGQDGFWIHGEVVFRLRGVCERTAHDHGARHFPADELHAVMQNAFENGFGQHGERAPLTSAISRAGEATRFPARKIMVLARPEGIR